jgi:cytochrome b561
MIPILLIGAVILMAVAWRVFLNGQQPTRSGLPYVDPRANRLTMYLLCLACAVSTIAAFALAITAGRPEFWLLIAFPLVSTIWIWQAISRT